MKYRHFLAVLFLVVMGCGSSTEEITDDITLTRQVTGGSIAGEYMEDDSIFVFKGIPFAAPPVGDLRWKAPQPVVPWEGIRETVAFGPSPFQAAPRPFLFWSEEFLIPEEPISEDCLYLNVWTGARKESEKRPVLLYIYGGGFQSGGSACPIYDGTAMAEKGVVFVSINYRVGKFGFLAHPELSAEAESGTSGNYALMDMIAALKWVQENISSFGGDPGRVTIAGQSAGSFAVNMLAASPLTRGLIHGAIGQSGASFYTSPLRPALSKDQAEQMGVSFAESVGASSLAELREVPADSILATQGGVSWPYVDGYVLPKSVHEIYLAGEQNDIPLLIGWNDNDIVMGQPREENEFRAMISSRFGDQAETFYEAYPAGSPGELTTAQFNMSRDETFGIHVYTWGKIQDSTGNSPVHMYNFNRAVPAETPETQFGAFHSGEIVYAYDNLETLNRPWEEADRQIAGMMSQYWANFAATGDPNGASLPDWPAYTRDRENVQMIDTETSAAILPTREKLLFWENYFLSLNENNP